MIDVAKETTLYLVRHGLTQANIEHLTIGNTDLPLIEEGLRQLPYLAEHFAALPVDAVFSSGMQRAWETASSIAGAKGLPVQVCRGLRERDFGPYEGLRVQDVVAQTTAQSNGGGPRYPGRFMLEGAETPQQVYDRISDALTDILRLCEGTQVVAVSHGSALQMAFAWLMQEDLETFEGKPILNLSVSKVRVGPGRRCTIESMGDVSFLPKEMRHLNNAIMHK